MQGKPPSTLSRDEYDAHYKTIKDNGLISKDDKLVFFWHAHSYGDCSDPEQKQALEDWYSHLQATNSRIDFGRLHHDAVGPHPVGMFELVFTRHAFTDVLTYLQFHRPAPLSIMIHPHTFQSLKDHTERAMWLGKQLSLSAGAPAMLGRFDERLGKELAGGADPADVLWVHHK